MVVVGRKFANEMMEKLEFVAIQRDKVLQLLEIHYLDLHASYLFCMFPSCLAPSPMTLFVEF
jgi:hypothetical protein